MRNAKKVLLTLILIVGVFTLAGCGSKKNDNKTKSEEKTSSKSSFKNPKEVVAVKGDKGTVNVTYEDDGTFEETASKDSLILKNADDNFRIYFEYTTRNADTLAKLIESYKKSDAWIVTENLKFGGYEAFAFTGVKTGTTEVYVYIDKANNIILDAKISPVMTSKVTEKLEKGTKPIDVLYGQEKVQQVLKSITYKK